MHCRSQDGIHNTDCNENHTITYGDQTIPYTRDDGPYKYLGIFMTANLDWRFATSKLTQHRAMYVKFLADKHLTVPQKREIINRKINAAAEYRLGVIDVSDKELRLLDKMALSAINRTLHLPRHWNANL